MKLCLCLLLLLLFGASNIQRPPSSFSTILALIRSTHACIFAIASSVISPLSFATILKCPSYLQ